MSSSSVCQPVFIVESALVLQHDTFTFYSPFHLEWTCLIFSIIVNSCGGSLSSVLMIAQRMQNV